MWWLRPHYEHVYYSFLYPSFHCRSGSRVLFGEALSEHDYEVFYGWLKCYDQPGMSKTKDRHRRTIWYHVSKHFFLLL